MRTSLRKLTALSFIAHVTFIVAAVFVQSTVTPKEQFKPTIVNVDIVERPSIAPSPAITQPEAAPVEETKRAEAKKEEEKAAIIKPKEIDKDALEKKLESLTKKVEKKKAEEKASDKIAALEKRLSEKKKKSENAKGDYAAASAGDELPNDYYDLVAARVRAAWIYPGDAPKDLMVSLEITTLPNGEVTDISIKQRSGNTLYDNTVLKAIKKASPLPPPPKGFKGRIGFRFCPVKCE